MSEPVSSGGLARLTTSELRRCPVCGGRSRPTFMIDGIWICDCLECAHRHADHDRAAGELEKLYGPDYFTGGKGGYGDYLSREGLLRRHGQRYAELLRLHGVELGRALDVGAAAGFLLAGLRDAGWDGVGIDPSAEMVAHGQQQLGLDLRVGALDELDDEVGLFQLVVMVQVLAHLVDPVEAVEQVASLLVPGGYCLVETWDRSSRTARAFGRRWHEYNPPSVLHWFDRRGVTKLFERAGFHRVACGTAAKTIDGANARSLLEHQWRGGGRPSSMARRATSLVPDKLAMRYPGDDAFWMLLRREGAAATASPG